MWPIFLRPDVCMLKNEFYLVWTYLRPNYCFSSGYFIFIISTGVFCASISHSVLT